jgi:hypothetical protein
MLAIDPFTKYCNVTVGLSGVKNSYCSQTCDDNQICIDKICQCLPNHKLNYETLKLTLTPTNQFFKFHVQ